MENKAAVLIIYTGGTIGMVQKDEDGSLVPMKFDKILEEVPELSRLGYKLSAVAFNPPIDSSNISVGIWIKIANTIKNNYHLYDGFVILHGTDTMAYTASALSFMLENLDKAVVLTGSQLPIGILRTDGKENLITSIEIAAAKREGMSMVPEVCVYFDKSLFRGNRTSKRHADHFSAFNSVNYPLLAKAGVKIQYFHENISYPSSKGILKVGTRFDEQVVILKIFPGIGKKVVESIVNIPDLKGIVLESYGAGNIPTTPWLIALIKKAIRRKIIVLNITQCYGGAVNMGHYQTSSELLKAGVVSGKDMTTEAAVTKLMFLLGQGLSQEDLKMHLNKNMSGEITE